MPRFVATASTVGVLILAALTLAHPSVSRILTWPFAAFAASAWLLLVGAFAIGCATLPGWRFPPRLITLGCVILAASAAVSSFSSPFAAATQPLLWPTLGGIAALFIFHHLWSASPSPRFATWIPIGGALWSVAAYAIWALDHGRFFPSHTRNTAPFGHSTYTAGACALVLPWLAFAAIRARALPRLLWLLALALALAVLSSTQSRGGVLAVSAVVAGAVTATLLFAPWSRARKLLLAALALGVIAGAFATNSRLRALALELRWSDSASESNLQRRAMLDAAALLGRERPLLGWGAGSIPLVYPRVRAQLDGGVENVLQVHNTPLQLWATGGGIALLGGAIIAAGLVATAWRTRRDPLALTASASLFGFGIFSLTDHALDLPFFALFAAANTAVLTRTALTPSRPPSPLRWTLAAGAIAIAALASPATLRDLQARLLFDRALTALETDRGNDFRELLERATAKTPHDPFFDHHAASYLLEARARANDPRKQSQLAPTAAAYLARSLATGVHLEFAHFNLGWLHLDLANPTAAARHFAAAARLVPDKGGVYFGLGLAYLAESRLDAAIRAFALEAINDPRSLASPAWEVPALARHLPAIHAETLRLFATLRQQHPAAAVSESWTRWLLRDPALAAADLRPHNAESAAFVAALPHIASLQPLPRPTPPFPSLRLYATWLAARAAAEPDFRAVMPAASPDYPALLARAQRYADDFREFLLAPTGTQDALVSTYRRQRTGYGILARHPEGPPLTDLYVVQENKIVSRFASGLLPRKGAIPGRFLLALLPDVSPITRHP